MWGVDWGTRDGRWLFRLTLLDASIGIRTIALTKRWRSTLIHSNHSLFYRTHHLLLLGYFVHLFCEFVLLICFVHFLPAIDFKRTVAVVNFLNAQPILLYPSILLSFCPSILLSFYPSLSFSILLHPSIFLSFYPSLSFYLSILLSFYPSILLDPSHHHRHTYFFSNQFKIIFISTLFLTIQFIRTLLFFFRLRLSLKIEKQVFTSHSHLHSILDYSNELLHSNESLIMFIRPWIWSHLLLNFFCSPFSFGLLKKEK